MSKINELYEYANKRKTFTAKDAVAKGFSRSTIKQAVDKKLIIRWGTGSYSVNGTAPDDYCEIQQRYKYFIYSNETALYLHNLTDVAFPKYAVTVPTGYNMKSNRRFKAYYVNKNIYELGIEEIESPYGSKIKVYNMDRTICDVIKNENRIENQIFSQAILYYVDSPVKNLSRALIYAKKMGIEKRFRTYLKIVQER